MTGDGVSPRWDRPGIPRKGWSCLDVEDHEEPDFQCELCGYPEVRFVHVMEHPEFPGPLLVGCVCAGHMEGDYAAPREREREARNRAQRRQRWCRSTFWRTSAKGNLWRKVGGVRVVIFPSPRGDGRWRAMIGERYGALSHPTPQAAMLAVFNRLFPPNRLRPGVELPGERGYR
jgi:hypothetical protein